MVNYSYRLFQVLHKLIKNPLSIFKIFDLKVLRRKLKLILSAQLPFNKLVKNYQIKVLFNVFEKINNLNLYNKKKKSNIISENTLIKLEKKYKNNSDCKKLLNLFKEYGSDKGSLAYLYFDIFKTKKIFNLLEIGLGSKNIFIRSNMYSGSGGGAWGEDNFKPGGSLRAFQKYLDANVYGPDIDKKILFQEKKIKTFFVDQLDHLTLRYLKKKIPKLDLIIDDGLHQPDANLNTIVELIEHLKLNGLIVVEDIEFIFRDIFKNILFCLNTNSKYCSQLIESKDGFVFVIKRTF